MGKMRYSKQREAIFEALKGSVEHPTAEMVYSWLKPEHKNLSLGTVYRNLNILADEGLVTKMEFSVERYDANTAPHPHLKCDKCGAVYDIFLPYDADLDKMASKDGHCIKSHEVVFHGTCADCSKRD